MQIRSQYLCPGNHRLFKVIQGNTITLAHPDEPYRYMQKHGKFVETRFHEVEHESKMPLLRTHSHTSEGPDYAPSSTIPWRRLYHEARFKARRTDRNGIPTVFQRCNGLSRRTSSVASLLSLLIVLITRDHGRICPEISRSPAMGA